MPRTKRNPRQLETNLELMSSTAIDALVAQHEANFITSLETPWNLGSGGIGCEISQGDNQGPTRICSYKIFTNYRPKPFHGNEGIVGSTR